MGDGVGDAMQPSNLENAIIDVEGLRGDGPGSDADWCLDGCVWQA